MTRSRLTLQLLALALLALSGCDWINYAFMNSIPAKGDPQRNPDVYVYLGVDGLSYHTVQDAISQGAFPSSEWKLAKQISAFPGTSDYSWTRIMHTEKLGGYEIEYYDPTRDEVINKGIVGLMKHTMPTLSDSMSFEEEYLKAFDYRANGYTHTLNAYRDTFVSLGDTLDNLFFLIDGRAETTSVFSAYLLEFDVLGHMQTSQDVGHSLMNLWHRIERFRARHPERRFHFTLISDHGMDFIRVKSDKLVKISDVLVEMGIQSVNTLLNHDPTTELYAIPIMHTRVTYVALHTHASLTQEVAGRVSRHASVDLAITRLHEPETSQQAATGLEWFGVWSEGKVSISFGFDSTKDEYHLPLTGQEYAKFGIDLSTISGTDQGGYKVVKDAALFQAVKNSNYPDIFYRTRTGLSTVGAKYPAEVIVSFKPTYCSLGFTIPGGDDIASAGFHGAMEQLGTLGTVLTNERDLPDAVRGDNFLELFPRMKEHMHARGIETHEGDPNSSISE